MINKKLLRLMEKEKVYILYLIMLKIVALLLNVGMIYCIANSVTSVINLNIIEYKLIAVLGVILLLQIGVIRLISAISNELSCKVKEKIRIKLFDKVYSYGMRYSKNFNIAEISQLSVNGIENLEVYFSSFIPQLVYSIVSPIILFCFLLNINKVIAIVLIVLVPLIPMAIILVQKLAKKINSQYWGSYVDLSEVFVDFLEGLTTLIIFNADEAQNKKLNKYAEEFRIKTMKVLSMQLNNITVLDIIAYSGAVLGILFSAYYYDLGEINIQQVLVVILISSEFFLPLRLLGSFFHIAMNGMGAVDHLFRVMETKEELKGNEYIDTKTPSIVMNNIGFSYNGIRQVLNNINMDFKFGTLNYLVGKSGCGKSTVAALLMNSIIPNTGEISYGGKTNLKEEEILKNATLVTNNPYLFKGTLRYNLQMGNEDIKESEMWSILEKLSLKDYFISENGLDTLISEQGNNFSGGQRQRIAIARAILKNSPIYIFDEATSNIDAESEDIIMQFIEELKKNKLIIIISHRLKHSVSADCIYYMENSEVKEKGTFKELIELNGNFSKLYNSQVALENWRIK